MRRLTLALGVLTLIGFSALVTAAPQQKKEVGPKPVNPNGNDKYQVDQNAKNYQNRAPEVAAPVAFVSKEGKKGWKVVIPGNRPLATPAVVDGKIFIGGGFGSHEFYAFDAKTGKKVWLYRTGDDGPTAAVVEGGYVAFNTESCELEILTVDGQRVWKKWLGDPLMSMPAIDRGRVFMCYPNSKGDRKHYLACFDIKNGAELWKRPIAGEIITAPVVNGEKLYLSTLEGTMYCFGSGDGELIWEEKKNATSSPAVWNEQVFFSRREAVSATDKDGKAIKQQTELLAWRETTKGAKVKDVVSTQRPADYLDHSKRAVHSPLEKMNQKADAGVGFGSAPADAKLYQAAGNLGQGTVCGVWSYQGSRPFFYQGRMYSAMGDTLKCVDPKTGSVAWKQAVTTAKEKEALVDSAVTPPAIVNGKLFVGTSRGEVKCLSAETGAVLWTVTVGEPILFQPAVSNGRVYVSTSTGSLFSFETGDVRDHGWLMWGGNAGHNGVVQDLVAK
jgi:Ca-activated chloride channel family protein